MIERAAEGLHPFAPMTPDHVQRGPTPRYPHESDRPVPLREKRPMVTGDPLVDVRNGRDRYLDQVAATVQPRQQVRKKQPRVRVASSRAGSQALIELQAGCRSAE